MRWCVVCIMFQDSPRSLLRETLFLEVIESLCLLNVTCFLRDLLTSHIC